MVPYSIFIFHLLLVMSCSGKNSTELLSFFDDVTDSTTIPSTTVTTTTPTTTTTTPTTTTTTPKTTTTVTTTTTPRTTTTTPRPTTTTTLRILNNFEYVRHLFVHARWEHCGRYGITHYARLSIPGNGGCYDLATYHKNGVYSTPNCWKVTCDNWRQIIRYNDGCQYFPPLSVMFQQLRDMNL